MARGVRILLPDGRDALDDLASRWSGDVERMRDIGVMKALACQFQSGYDIFSFYLERARAIYESRVRGDFAAAAAAVRRMRGAVDREESVTRRLLPLAAADSRLGFHPEAEAHQYHPAKLEWRLGELASTRARLDEIEAALVRGEPYPESAFEKSAHSAQAGEWVVASDSSRLQMSATDSGDLSVAVEFKRGTRRLRLCTLDAAGVSWYRSVAVDDKGARPYPQRNVVSPAHEVADCQVERSGGRVTVRFKLLSAGWGGRSDRRPEWIMLMNGAKPVWPDSEAITFDWRLNLDPVRANRMGRFRGWN